jgi:hypothetical protein
MTDIIERDPVEIKAKGDQTKADASPAPINHDDLADKAIRRLARFKKLTEQEIEAIEQGRFEMVGELREEKEMISKECNLIFTHLGQQKSLNMSADKKTELAQAQKALQPALTKNLELIEKTHQVQSRLWEMIVGAAKRAADKPANYAPNGVHSYGKDKAMSFQVNTNA